MQFDPKKLYYKIREVSEIVGVETHVLRFWETEFPSLCPPKSKSGQRTYRPKDIELLLRIRKLLYEDGFTISGARKQLGTLSSSVASDTTASAPRSKNKRKPSARKKSPAPKSERLDKVKSELENILTLLDRG